MFWGGGDSGDISGVCPPPFIETPEGTQEGLVDGGVTPEGIWGERRGDLG